MVRRNWKDATEHDDAKSIANGNPDKNTDNVLLKTGPLSSWLQGFLHTLNGFSTHSDSDTNFEETAATTGMGDSKEYNSKKKGKRKKKEDKPPPCPLAVLLIDLQTLSKKHAVQEIKEHIDASILKAETALQDDSLCEHKRSKVLTILSSLREGRKIAKQMQTQLESTAAATPRTHEIEALKSWTSLWSRNAVPVVQNDASKPSALATVCTFATEALKSFRRKPEKTPASQTIEEGELQKVFSFASPSSMNSGEYVHQHGEYAYDTAA